MTPKETYAMLVRVYEDQAVSMKCVYECSPVFETAEKVFLITPVAEDWRSLSVMKTLREKERFEDLDDRAQPQEVRCQKCTDYSRRSERDTCVLFTK
ncbi:uncharacterized protein TNCV_4495561 [Trichonephila clavipes]|nr:uncharacterized protein TNCV_4495561 [Trichonephila clavipes]